MEVKDAAVSLRNCYCNLLDSGSKEMRQFTRSALVSFTILRAPPSLHPLPPRPTLKDPLNDKPTQVLTTSMDIHSLKAKTLQWLHFFWEW